MDEKDLPDKPKVKVRCPHCHGIGYIENRSASKPIPQASSPEEKPVSQPQKSKFELPESISDQPQLEYDVSLTHDAFKEFRFPAEQERHGNARSNPIALKTIIWAAASLLVVLFFALLVNIILPGPAGVKGVSGALQSEEEQTITKTGEDIDPINGSVPGPPRQKR